MSQQHGCSSCQRGNQQRKTVCGTGFVLIRVFVGSSFSVFSRLLGIYSCRSLRFVEFAIESIANEIACNVSCGIFSVWPDMSLIILDILAHYASDAREKRVKKWNDKEVCALLLTSFNYSRAFFWDLSSPSSLKIVPVAKSEQKASPFRPSHTHSPRMLFFPALQKLNLTTLSIFCRSQEAEAFYLKKSVSNSTIAFPLNHYS